FQAEDGIRDRNVTGVQTCALPISFWRTGVPLERLSARMLIEQDPDELCGNHTGGKSTHVGSPGCCCYDIAIQGLTNLVETVIRGGGGQRHQHHHGDDDCESAWAW